MAPGVTTNHLYDGLRELRGLNRVKMPERRREWARNPEFRTRNPRIPNPNISGGDRDRDDDSAGGGDDDDGFSGFATIP
jgi:hypothetical protein